MSLNPNASLAQAIAWLHARREAGVACPCCGQMAKVYKRKINAGMANSLIAIYRVAKGIEDEFSWVHVPTQIGARSREEGKLAYWNLVEEQLTVRPDGGRAGWWRLTEAGAAFVQEQIRVRKYAHVYDGRCLQLSGDFVSIRDALGSKFSYDELMRA